MNRRIVSLPVLKSQGWGNYSPPVFSESDTVSLKEVEEVNRRIWDVQSRWTDEEREEREERRTATVSSRHEGGLYFVHDDDDFRRWSVPFCKMAIQRKVIEDESTHADCHYWMHDC